jgi:predicted aspartyl protease
MIFWAAFVAIFVGTAAPQESRGSLGVFRMPDDLAREIGIDLGAGVLHVVPRSPADRAGIVTGDAIIAVNGEKVADFDEMAAKIAERKAGDKVSLDIRRNSSVRMVQTTLVRRASEIGEAGYRATLENLRSIKVRREGPARIREIADAEWNLGERAKALKTAEAGAERFPDSADLAERRLEYLSKNGRFTEYVQRGLERGKQPLENAELRMHHIEALLASNRNEEAERESAVVMEFAVRMRNPTHDFGRAYQAWMEARMRQGKPLTDRTVDGYLATVTMSPGVDQRRVTAMAAWRDLLRGLPPYQIRSPKNAKAELEYQLTGILMGLIPERMNGITVKINGVDVPLAIIDTGASHTLIHDSIAEKAKVETGNHSHGAHGSLNFTAKSGVVRELKIGDIVLHNVPVNIGNPPPLVMTKAKAALGVDLMHHLQFTIDYPKKKVTVKVADAAEEKPESPEKVWDIPLFPFSEHTLAEGTMPSGAKARVLIDSGNFAHTLLWAVWGKANIPGHRGPAKGLFEFATGDPNHKIVGLTLGGRKLPDWPAMDMPPVTLQGVDLLDLLMGHDLLSQYVVTIDMRGRRLRLRSHGDVVKPPVAPKGP